MTVSSTGRMPDFVVLGQGKAGTSLIYRVLSQDPRFGLSDPKELHFFSQREADDLEWYHAQFPNPDAQVLAEVSPSYLAPEPLEHAARHLPPTTKVAFVLRRPVEQMYARYLQNICAREEGPGFWDMVPQLRRRLAQLTDAIGMVYDIFGPERVLPLMFEQDVAVANAPFARKICSFLGLDPDLAPPLPEDRVNPTVMPHYLYAGDRRLYLMHEGQRFMIPPHRLVFCAQARNSKVYLRPEIETLTQAFALSSRWSSAVEEVDYARMQEEAVLPMAEALSVRFGLDLSHWDVAPRRIAYPMAPPPASLRYDGEMP